MALLTIDPVLHVFNRNVKYEKSDFFYFSNISIFLISIIRFIGLFGKNSTIFNIKNYLIPISITLERTVSIIFWPLFIFKRESVTRENLEPGIRSYFNEMPKHLFPLLSLMLESENIKIGKYTTQKYFLLAFAIIYHLIIEYFIKFENFYIYPMFSNMRYSSRLMTIGMVLLVAVLIHEYTV